MVLAPDDVAMLQGLAADLIAERGIEDMDDLSRRAALILRSATTFAHLLAALADDAAQALNDEDAADVRAEADQTRRVLDDLAGDLTGPLLAAWRRRQREQGPGF